MSLEFKPSVLIVAPKRSGTNFVHDVIAPAFPGGAVNEPLGLHNDTPGGRNNPLNPWNFSSAEHVSEKYGHIDLKDDSYGALLARNFLGWLRQGGTLIKETDFLSLGWLLASVPLKIIRIKRDPRESIASFKKHDLYQKWGFQEKMIQLAETIRNNPILDTKYGGCLRIKDMTTKPSHQKLAFYYSIALSEITRNTKDQETFDATYEEIANESIPTFHKIMKFINSPWNEQIAKAIIDRTSSTRDAGAHGTFRSKYDLTIFSKVLTTNEEADIRSICFDFGIILPIVKTIFSTTLAKKEKPKIETELIPVQYVDRQEEIQSIRHESVQAGLPESLYIAKTLTTNIQYARFLKWLREQNFPLSIRGKPLFYNDRPQAKIRTEGDSIAVERGYSDHPVNFINWIGAAAYSVWVGGRLPSAKEWENTICHNEFKEFKMHGKLESDRVNIGQIYSGTTPVTFFSPNEIGIHDALGNASIWINNPDDENKYEKQRAGLEWNHTSERGISPSPRPYWLGTSGLGVRPVFSSLVEPVSDELYLFKMQEIVQLLTSETLQDSSLKNKELFSKFDDLSGHNK